MPPQQRLRYLVELRHFLSDWSLACCFHLAREARWGLSPGQTFACLKSPTGFVRESVLSYLQMASPKALIQSLPVLKQDPNPLVRAQVDQIMAELGLHPTSGLAQLPPPSVSTDSVSNPQSETQSEAQSEAQSDFQSNSQFSSSPDPDEPVADTNPTQA